MPSRFRSLGHILFLSAAISVLFILLNPSLIIYQQDSYPLPYIFWLKLLGLTLLTTGLITLFASLAHWLWSRIRHGKSPAIALLQAIFLTFFCITVFFPQASPLQDGSTAIEPKFLELLPLYLVYLLAVGLLFILATKYSILIKRFVALSLLFTICIVSYMSLSTIHQFVRISKSSEIADHTFGSNNNIIVIVADMLQGTSVAQALKIYPELQKDLSDFTCYTHGVGPFPFTTYALPAILSGNVYTDNSPKATNKDNAKAAYADSFLTDAENAGYITTVYSGGSASVIGLADKVIRRNTDWELKRTSTHDLLNYIDVGFLRIFKRRFFLRDDLNALMASDVFYEKLSAIQDITYLAAMPVGDHENKLIVQHNLFPHAPHARWQEVNNEVTFEPVEQNDYAAYMAEINFFFERIHDLIIHMKELNIYDKSLIIIVADHGHPAPPMAGSPTDWLREMDNRGFWAYPASSYNPAFLIKCPNASYNQMQISEEYITNLSVRKIIRGYVDGEHNYDKILEEQDKTIVLIEKDTEIHPFYGRPAHVSGKITGGLAEVPSKLIDISLAKLSYDHLPLNQSVNIVDLHLPLGFLAREESGAWLTDKRALLTLDASEADISQNCSLNLTGFPLVNASHPQQRLIVTVNGVPVNTPFIMDGNTNSINIPISAADLKKAQGKISLEITSPDAVTPKSIGAWDFDNNAISIFLQSVTLNQ